MRWLWSAVFFFVLALVAAASMYLDTFGAFSLPILFKSDLLLFISAAAGFFYSIYALLRHVVKGGDTLAEVAADETAQQPDPAGRQAGRFTYWFRPGYFSDEITCRLTEKSLAWEGGGGGEILFPDIGRIRICEDQGNRERPECRRCVVTTASGRERVLSSNHRMDFPFIFYFESRMPEYRLFVDELFRRVRAANPNVEYWVGYSPWGHRMFTAAIGVTTAIFAVCIVVPAFVLSEPGAQEILLALLFSSLALGVAAIALVPAWRSIRRNRPRRFDPRTEDPLPWPAAATAHLQAS